MTYDECVESNLNNCFNDKEEISNMNNYKDPDNFSNTVVDICPIIMISNNNDEEKKKFSITLRTDGLISIKKIQLHYNNNYNNNNTTNPDNYSDKKLYSIFRENMGGCLRWPCRTWSINQARRSYGNDDRLDLLLIDIEGFYKLCEKYKNDGICANFIKEVYEKIPKAAFAFLNMPTLIWLCSFENFNKFIEENKLQHYVKKIKEKFTAYEYEDYYKVLLENTKKYRKEYIKIIKSPTTPSHHKYSPPNPRHRTSPHGQEP